MEETVLGTLHSWLKRWESIFKRVRRMNAEKIRKENKNYWFSVVTGSPR